LGRPFIRYLLAQTVSSLGTYIGRTALAFMVYDVTHSALAMGTLYLIAGIPETVIRLFGAPLIDRLPRHRLMALLDLGRFAIYLVPWALWTTGHASVWTLYLLAFVTGAAGGLYAPAAMSIIPSLVEPDRLLKANSTLTTVNTAAGILGPVIGVALCALLNNANALLLDGISFGICGLMLATLPIQIAPAQPKSGRGLSGYFAELTEGFAFFRQAPALLTITAVLALSNVGSSGSMAVMLPLIREGLRAPQELLGEVQTAISVGFLAGSFLTGFLALRLRRRFVMLSSLALIQLAQILSALLTPRLALMLIPLWALFGIGSITYSINSTQIYQEMVPDRLRGRAMSVRMLLGLGAQPLGQFLGGVIAERWGPSSAFLVGGLVPLIVTVISFTLPALRSLDNPTVIEPERAAQPKGPAVKQQATP
jgi:MFS family permease